MKIKVSYGLTVNKGNYESERIDVSMEHTVDPNDFMEAFDKDFKYLKEWVWQKGGKL